MKNSVRFVLDGKIREVDFSKNTELKPTTTVLNYLRSFPEHKGVKEGCAEGDCGACTIVVAEINDKQKLDYKTLDSCLVFLPMIQGKQIITVENLAIVQNNEKTLHPVQKLMVVTNGSQCGYCTPGIVMSLFGLYKNHQNPSPEIIDNALTGNLCRCTGYRPIIEAAQKVCVNYGIDHFSKNENEVMKLLNKINNKTQTLILKNKNQRYYKPFNLKEALRLRKEFPNALVINGSTDVALRQTKRNETLTEILDLSAVVELKFIREEEKESIIGAGVTIEQLRNYSVKKFPSLKKILDVFGSLQIRNIATIGGNVGSASPIGDSIPVLFAYGAKIKLQSETSERIVAIEKLIKGYRQTDIRNDELITEITIPNIDKSYFVNSYKISKRKDMDISTVSAAFCLKLEGENISEIKLVFGGMAEIIKHAVKTEKLLLRKKWCRENIENAMKILEKEFTPLSDARSEAEFRNIAAKNLLLKFYLETKVNYELINSIDAG